MILAFAAVSTITRGILPLNVMSIYCVSYSFGFPACFVMALHSSTKPNCVISALCSCYCASFSFLSRRIDSTKDLQFREPCIAMRPTTYVATISFGNLYISLCVAMTSRLLAIGLRGIMLLRMWPLLLNFTTISSTMVMTTSHLLSSASVGLLVPEVYQSFGLRDDFINSTDMLAF